MTGARRGRATATLAFDHIGSFADTTEDGNLYISIGVKAATRDAAGGVGSVSVADNPTTNPFRPALDPASLEARPFAGSPGGELAATDRH